MHPSICFTLGLNSLIRKLDRRHEAKIKTKKGPMFKGHPRVIRSPLKKSPKPGAPKWALADAALPAVNHMHTTPISHVLSSSHRVLNFDSDSSISD